MNATISFRRFSPLSIGTLFYVFLWSAMAVHAPFLNVYFVELGFTGRQIGLLAALFPLMVVLFSIPLSSLADRNRWRIRMLQFTLLSAAIGFALLSLPRTFSAFFPLLAVIALFRSPLLALADSLTARMAARHQVNYGQMRLGGSLGFALVSIGCGVMWSRWGYEPMFFVSAVVFLLVIPLASQLEEGPVLEKDTFGAWSDIGQDRGLVLILLATFFIGMSLGASFTFEAIAMAQLGGSSLWLGLLTGFVAFSEVPVMFASDRLIARWGGLKTLLVAYSLLMLGFIGFMIAPSPSIMLLMAILRGLGFGLFLVSTVRLLDARAPDAWSTTVQALRDVATFGLAPLIAAPLAGVLFDAVGVQAVFLLAFTMAFLAAGVLMLARWRGIL